jgi:hypothetical protein
MEIISVISTIFSEELINSHLRNPFHERRTRLPQRYASALEKLRKIDSVDRR